MKTKWLWGVASLFVIFSLAACSALPNDYNRNVRQMTSSGSGVVYLTPDVAYIQIGVESRSDQVANALSENNAQTDKVASTLKDMGVDAKDIQTSAFNIMPQQEYSPTGEVAGTVYVVNNTVYVTIRDLQNLGNLLDAVVRSGANNIYGIQFDVQDKKTAISEARKLAIDEAKANAQEVSSAAGITLGDIISLNVYSPSGPIPMLEGKGGAAYAQSAAVPVSAGQLTLTMNADLTYEIK